MMRGDALHDAGPDAAVLELARSLAAELMAGPAHAVILAGSQARGQAHRESDVDLYALGTGPAYRLDRRAGYLIATSFRTPEEVRASFLNPTTAGTAVPGWREAIVLSDPQGIARALKQEAERWTWDVIPLEVRVAAVADGVAGFAEEVHKLVISLERGDTRTAAVQRSLLAVRLARYMAIHLGLLYGSENRLWDLIADRLGDRWRRAQGAALGAAGEPFASTCQAALQLYALAAEAVWESLDPDQRAVVAHACAIAGHVLPATSW